MKNYISLGFNYNKKKCARAGQILSFNHWKEAECTLWPNRRLPLCLELLLYSPPAPALHSPEPAELVLLQPSNYTLASVVDYRMAAFARNILVKPLCNNPVSTLESS